jgi:hypothetical protein
MQEHNFRRIQHTVKKFSTLDHTNNWRNESPHLLVWVLTKKGTVHFGTH